MAIPSFSLYNIGTVLVPAGTLKFGLFSTDGSLVVPTDIVKTISFDDYITSGYGEQVGVSQTSQVTFNFVDVATADYPEGFWFHVLNEEACEIRIFIDEAGAGTYTFLFWGRVVRETPPSAPVHHVAAGYYQSSHYSGKGGARYFRETQPAFDAPGDAGAPGGGFTELSLISGAIIRQGSFQCSDAFIARLQEVTVTELDAILDDVSFYVEILGVRYLEFRTIFCGMIFLISGQSIDLTDVSAVSDSLNYKAGASYYGFDEVSIQAWDVASSPLGRWNEWLTSYSNCLEVLRDILIATCLYLRFDFDVASLEIRIRLVGKASNQGFSTKITEDVPFSSALAPRSQIALRVIDVNNGVGSGATHFVAINGTVFNLTEVPSTIQSDLQIALRFNTDGLDKSMFRVSGGVATNVSDLRYWTGGGWSSDVPSHEEAVCKYMEAHFGASVTSLREYQREYATMKVTLSGVASHTNALLGPNCWVSIDDGGGSPKDFVATTVGKNPISDRLKITWIEAV